MLPRLLERSHPSIDNIPLFANSANKCDIVFGHDTMSCRDIMPAEVVFFYCTFFFEKKSFLWFIANSSRFLKKPHKFEQIWIVGLG